ncbi:hypothetical protein SAMN05444678_1088 [Sphingomonas sp. YR710]|jgi:hypothetical protein|uniref:DUF2218 domain-containing protein n=1 Tax=Sphingomonas sp. YR710 TaxID=1882773 RepID=UPI0008910EFC|nr:DUF2218 domain-containing protein [Sphingomonas sp. YR710]SDD01570.1 hypothetical protein SAMN05444678_1088 [Sphingomonas sp. YR710]
MATNSMVARVPTAQGSRYLQQLCKHWSHKMVVEFTAEAGKITFPAGAVVTMTAHPADLEVEIALPPGGEADQMQKVVASHLDRFAFREAPLAFDWAPG